MPGFEPGLRVIFPQGKVAIIEGRIYDYRGRARDAQRRHILVSRDDVPVTFTDDELLRLQQTGSISVVSPTQVETATDGTGKLISALDAATPEARQIALARAEYVLAWKIAGRPSRTPEGLCPIIDAVTAQGRDKRAPAPRTLARWIELWLDGGEDIAALLPNTDRCGWWADKLHPKVRDILCATIDKVYLKRQRHPVTAVHAAVKTAIDDYNKPLPAECWLQAPSRDTVYAEVRRLNAFERDVCRLGTAAARQTWGPRGPGPAAARHNDVWEIDHTLVDLIVLDGETGLPIGRPWVTVIIDRATRAIMGLHITFQAPDAASVLDCLRSAILRKDELLSDISGVQGPWPCFGVPLVIVPDRGPEFRSSDFREACRKIGSDVQYTPVLKAWYKGTIERFLKTLSRDTFHRIPGTTFENIFRRDKDKVPERVAVCTIEELRTHVLQYIVDVYMPREHRTLRVSPLFAWKASVEAHGGVVLPPSAEELARTLLPITRRVIQNTGIHLESNVYYHDDLIRLRVRLEPSTPVIVRMDPNDITRVFVVAPDTGEVITAMLHEPLRTKLAGVTLRKHRLALAMQRNNPEVYAGTEGALRAHADLDEAMRKKASGRKQHDRRSAQAYFERQLRARRSEDPTIYDRDASAQSLIPVFDDGAPDDEAGAPDAENMRPAAEPSEGSNSATRDAATKSRSSGPEQAAATPSAPAVADSTGPSKPAGAAEDGAALALRLGLTVKKI